ncbi:MAG: hypothetical protein V2A73_19455 [Pseudomonadota bacterium]
MRCLFVHSAHCSCRPSRILAAAVLVVTLVHGSVAATAAENEKDDWSKSFDPKTVASGIPVGESGDLALVVVAAGPVSLSVEAAASALEQALRASGRPKLVMDDAGLGSMESLDDAAIVARCSYLPITHVAVVRIFPGQPGQPTQAVVTFYAKAGGEAVAAVAAPAGGTAVPTNTAAIGSGVSASTVEAVLEARRGRRQRPPRQVTPATAVDSEAARQQFERRYVVFGRPQDGEEPFLGKQRTSLGGAEFYNAVGRPDLAARFSSRQRVRNLFGTGALIAGGVGLFALVIGASADCSYEDVECGVGSVFSVVMGLELLAVGVAGGVVVSLVQAHPVPSSTRIQIADDHNRRLRRQLGLPEETDTIDRTNNSAGSTGSAAASGSSVGLAIIQPVVVPGGGGLVLSGVF